jgi:hypothetical protein
MSNLRCRRHHIAPVIFNQIGPADPDKAHRKQQEAEGKQQRGSGKVFDKNAFQYKFTPRHKKFFHIIANPSAFLMTCL